jgi:division protein CdvB (Snf7/Vps24/ESCRT-III family)
VTQEATEQLCPGDTKTQQTKNTTNKNTTNKNITNKKHYKQKTQQTRTQQTKKQLFTVDTKKQKQIWEIIALLNVVL